MSFDELYESCLRNASLVKVPSGKSMKEDDSSLLVTLDYVMNSSQFIVFFLTSGSKGSDLGLKLDNMVRKKNEKNDKDKPQNSPARIRRFFSMKKKKKKKETDETAVISIVLVDTDYRAVENLSGSLAQPGWYVYAPQAPSTKSRLLRSLGFDFPPSLIIVDTTTRNVITTDARRLLTEDVNGSAFPWWPPLSSDILKGDIVSRSDGVNKISNFSSVSATVRGLFFGAHWCPPCRQWVKQLSPIYEQLKNNNISIEVIFCSSDRSQELFDQFLDQMPWPAFTYDPIKTMALTRVFNVSGIPSLILIDESGRLISRHGRSSILGDSLGNKFPWGPQPLYELNEFTVCRLRDEPSLILFTEGTPEDIQFSLSVLNSLSNQLFDERLKLEERRLEEREKKQEERENNDNGNSLCKSTSSEECSSTGSDIPIPPYADPLQILYTGEDPICDHILETILGLGDVELPLICIVDGLAGQLAICEKPDVSEIILDEFVAEYRTGKLKWEPLPTSKHVGKTVAGIPTSMIEQALIGSSPSQNSLGKDELNSA